MSTGSTYIYTSIDYELKIFLKVCFCVCVLANTQNIISAKIQKSVHGDHPRGRERCGYIMERDNFHCILH